MCKCSENISPFSDVATPGKRIKKMYNFSASFDFEKEKKKRGTGMLKFQIKDRSIVEMFEDWQCW